jgi:hypothetical protein
VLEAGLRWVRPDIETQEGRNGERQRRFQAVGYREDEKVRRKESKNRKAKNRGRKVGNEKRRNRDRRGKNVRLSASDCVVL